MIYAQTKVARSFGLVVDEAAVKSAFKQGDRNHIAVPSDPDFANTLSLQRSSTGLRRTRCMGSGARRRWTRPIGGAASFSTPSGTRAWPSSVRVPSFRIARGVGTV